MSEKTDSFDQKAIEAYELIIDRCINALKTGAAQDVGKILLTIDGAVESKFIIARGYYKMRAPEAFGDFDQGQPPRETSQLEDKMLEGFRNPPPQEQRETTENET